MMVKKKSKRILILIFVIIIPSISALGYVFLKGFFDNPGSFKVFYKDLKEKGLDKLIFPKLSKLANSVGLGKLGIGGSVSENSNESSNDGLATEENDNSEMDNKIPVTVFKAFKTGFRDTLPALGTLKGHRETKLGFEKPGTLESFNFKEGDLVPKGALVCSLNKQESEIRVRQAEARLKEAQSILSLADNKFKRMEQKFNLGGVSQSEYENAKLEYEKATHTSEVSKSDVENAKYDLKKCDLFANYEGLLGNKYVEVGETISSNTLVCDIIDVDFMNVEIGIVERDIEKVAAEQKVSIFVDAYPNREFIGKVETISPVVEGQSRTFSVKIKLANQQKLLLPGMFARVKINVFEQKDALVIPTSAIVNIKNKTYVYVINPDSQIANQRPVAVTYSTSDYAVIARGLRDGEIVAIGEKQGIGEGSKVNIIERQVPET